MSLIDSAVAVNDRSPAVAGDDVAELRAERTKVKVDELAIVRGKLLSSVIGHVTRAADRLLNKNPLDRLSDEDFKVFDRSVTQATRQLSAERDLARLEKRLAVRVVSEPRVYHKKSDCSYYSDLIDMRTRFDTAQEARDRLQRYDRELAYEILRGSKEGRRAARLISESMRSEDVAAHRRVAERAVAEVRAVTTGGGMTAAAGAGAAAFVSPAFLLTEWAAFRGANRAFADACHKAPLPAFGMQVYVPVFSTTDSVTQQTEGSVVSEIDPSTQLQGSGAVQMVTGQITVTQQLRDRGYSGGGSFDAIIARQLKQQLDQAVDVYTLNQVLAGGGSVAGAASYTTGNLYADLAKAREVITDTAGTRLRPTHLFTTSDLYSFATRQVDGNSRPILQPQFAPGYPIVQGADDDNRPAWSRFSGTVLPGGVLWFLDDNIPQVGTTGQTQLVVSAPADAVILCEGEPILAAFPQTAANVLDVVLNLRAYVAVIARHAQGTASIAGSAYPASAV